MPLFRDFFERFGASNCRKLKGFAQNAISGTSKKPPKSLKVFRGAAWNPFFAEITKIGKLRNKIAHALRNLILLKFQLSENKCIGKRWSGCQICGWNLSVHHQNDPVQKTTSSKQKWSQAHALMDVSKNKVRRKWPLRRVGGVEFLSKSSVIDF